MKKTDRMNSERDTQRGVPRSSAAQAVSSSIGTACAALDRGTRFLLVVVLLSLILPGICLADQKPAPLKSEAKPARKNVKLPGLLINFKDRCVDLDATICLDRGALELIACTKDTKEHESIVAIDALPRHVHTALLLIGAQSGNPAMRKRVSEGEQERWVEIPPSGGRVNVYLVTKDDKGTSVEHPISKFIKRSGDDDESAPDSDPNFNKDAKKKAAFPNTFLFTGSLIREIPGQKERQYLCDASGNVISIATFGDETLGLPAVHSHQNGALLWQVNDAELPKVGSKVILRLRPQPQKTRTNKTSTKEP